MNASGKKKTWNIAYVIDPTQDKSNTFIRDSLISIEEVAAKNHYNVLFECFQERELNLMNGNKVDGLIICSGKAYEYLKASLKLLPMVLLNCSEPILVCDTVMPDNTGGMFKAVEYFAKLGHKKIGFLGSAPEYSKYSCNYAERFHGFAMACNYYKVSSVSAMLHLPIKYYSENVDAVYDIYSKWKRMKKAPTAIVSVNHMYGCILRTIDANIPIIAGDNKREIDIIGQKIDMLEQNVQAMGKMAAELLLQRIKEPKRIPVRLNCDMKPTFDK